MFDLWVGIVTMIGTAVGMIVSMLLFGKWLVRSLVDSALAGFADEKLAPLNSTLVNLDKSAALLTQSLEDAKAMQARDHLELQKRDREMHRAVMSLEKLVQGHETQLREHSSAIAELQRAQRRGAE